MRVVLDSNEYINFLNKTTQFLGKLIAVENIKIYANDTIVKEVLRNIKETIKGDFYKILFQNKIVIKSEKPPFYFFGKYNNLGLKKGDITIAAFCEYVKANYLITENRHFLKGTKINQFKVLSMRDFLNNVIK